MVYAEDFDFWHLWWKAIQIYRLGDQRARVYWKQLSSEVANETNTTRQLDDTKKLVDVYEVFVVRDGSSKNWVLGLREMLYNSSENWLLTFKSILDYINSCFLANLKYKMSDKAATEFVSQPSKIVQRIYFASVLYKLKCIRSIRKQESLFKIILVILVYLCLLFFLKLLTMGVISLKQTLKRQN